MARGGQLVGLPEAMLTKRICVKAVREGTHLQMSELHENADFVCARIMSKILVKLAIHVQYN
jgi:hypothetical protein